MRGPLVLVVAAAAVAAFACTASASGSSSGRMRQHQRPTHPHDPAFLMNNLLELDESMPECSAAYRRVQHGERDAQSSYPPDLRGVWVSQECETRPGPEFVLRQYQFERDGSFKLLQHFYSDEWCTTPVYTLTAKGELQLREPSWVVPGGAEAEYTLQRVALVAYSEDVVDEVMQRVNHSCPGYVTRPWRVRKEYLIYNYGTSESTTRPAPVHLTNNRRQQQQQHGNGSSRNKANSDLRPKRVSHNGSHYHHAPAPEASPDQASSAAAAADEIDCLSAFHAVYHELQLVRTVRRPRDFLSGTPDSPPSPSPSSSHHHAGSSNNNKKKSHHQAGELSFLFLGNIHPHLEQRASYRPTSYQPPLVRHHEASDCHVCKEVARSTDKSAPHLHARPRLPVYPLGDWVSSSCETRPIGTFLMRRMKFIEHSGTVMYASATPTFQALFHYYSDPICSKATLSVLASGHYSPGSDSERVQGATEFDFYVQSVIITVHDESTARNLNGLKGNQCGIDGSWQVGRPQDVTLTGGCIGLGIRVPTVANDLLKMDLNELGHRLLYFGIAENPAEPRSAASASDPVVRPTSYLPPMQQCYSGRDELSLMNDVANELGAIVPHARVAAGDSSAATAASSHQKTFELSFCLLLAFVVNRLLHS